MRHQVVPIKAPTGVRNVLQRPPGSDTDRVWQQRRSSARAEHQYASRQRMLQAVADRDTGQPRRFVYLRRRENNVSNDPHSGAAVNMCVSYRHWVPSRVSGNINARRGDRARRRFRRLPARMRWAMSRGVRQRHRVEISIILKSSQWPVNSQEHAGLRLFKEFVISIAYTPTPLTWASAYVRCRPSISQADH
jgi:hypothetical protein